MGTCLLLHFSDNLSRHWRMEIDGVMPQTLCSLVAFPTATFDWFADTYLRPMAILGMVFYTIYILLEKQRRIKFTYKGTECEHTQLKDIQID